MGYGVLVVGGVSWGLCRVLRRACPVQVSVSHTTGWKTRNLFVIANVKQLRTDGIFRILLPFFFRTSWGAGVLNSAIFNSFHNRDEFGTIFEGFRNFGGGG